MTRVDTPQGICRFGFARRDITPPAGIYHRMWGASLHDRAEGVHRPLTLSALSLASAASGAGSVTLIAIDHCLLFAPAMERLEARVRAAVEDLEPESLVVTFSHTHAAGLMDPERAELPGGDLIAPYLERLADAAAAAVGEARAGSRECTIACAQGRSDLAAHRDYRDAARGIHVCGFNPLAPADDAVTVLGVSAADGAPLATIVHYACHPTTLAWENRLISPDYPGALRELVERETGAACVFLQGASGELGPRQGYSGETALADRHGRRLGHAALSALLGLGPPRHAYHYRGPVISGATLGIWEHRPLGEAEIERLRRFRLESWTLPLPYRADLPSLEATRADLEARRREEAGARAAGDALRERDLHALVERLRRQSARLEALPPGPAYPYRVRLWQIGGILFLAVPGEPYSLLQRELRRRFPEAPIVVLPLSGGWGPSYLPEAGAYGKGVYQDSVALLAPGCLERVIESAAERVESWLRGERASLRRA
jgi:hypothetical protein